MSLDRRAVLTGLSAVLGITGIGTTFRVAQALTQPSENDVFSFDRLNDLAASLARNAFDDRHFNLPPVWQKLSYDEYRDIRFRSDKAIFGPDGEFQMQLFAPGGFFDRPVDLFLVENGRAKPLEFSTDLFDFGKVVSASRPTLADDTAGKSSRGNLTYSGFRIHGFINKRDYRDEFLVFQGASYFRATGRHQNYGLSARGLAINTAQPKGEEFPYFRSFWIETPSSDAKQVAVYALLDSPSVTGAYKFKITPDEYTVIDVDLVLHPREEVTHFGIAPLTSMFLFGEAEPARYDDYRPSVYDSEGLSILNGSGEWLWRPLVNPAILQTSAFLDENPKGFGLILRNRAFTHFQDLEARYELRPSLWIEPRGNWGKGNVTLFELPTAEETNDNIVAFWQPDTPLKPGAAASYSYQMFWGPGVHGATPVAVVSHTLTGKASGKKRRFVVEFAGRGLDGGALPTALASCNQGDLSDVAVQKNPVTGAIRASFSLDPKDAEAVDIRLSLERDGKAISEVWIYRWTRNT